MKKKVIRMMAALTFMSSLGWSGMVMGQEGESDNSCAAYIAECQSQKNEAMTSCQQENNASACEGDSECIQNIEEDRRLCQNDANELYQECIAQCQE